MGKELYGVDLSGKITPVMVRDAIIRCFKAAHAEVLEEMNRNKEFRSESERGNFEKIQVDLIVMSVFDDIGADFNNPTKADIIKVLDRLATFAARFRKPEIIRKHYNEIMQLVEKLE